jgi:hypothetical protein
MVRRRRSFVFAACALLAGASPTLRAQLLDNLSAFTDRFEVSEKNPGSFQGPKAIAVQDFDGDGRPDFATANTDGRISVFFHQEGSSFVEVTIETGAITLRDIAAANWTADLLPDIAVTAPVEGKLFFVRNRGARSFEPPEDIPTWSFARNLAAGDFDGDGIQDLLVAGSGLGVREYRGLKEGGLRPVADLPALDAVLLQAPTLKPVYTLETYRLPGSARDEVIAVNADGVFAGGIRGAALLSLGESGALEVRGSVPLPRDARSLVTGVLTRPAAEAGPVDLVTLHTSSLEEIQVHRGVPGPERFETAFHQRLPVPGGPRAAVIVDLDGDGWNDLGVVVRNRNRVTTYRNVNGTLELAYEAPVGNSPRGIARADFDGDGKSDVAVINRTSADVSVLHGLEGIAGFSMLDQVYLADGEVSGLALSDLNGDGRGDVVQTHRASGDLSVRLAGPGGRLDAPAFFPMGLRPSSLVLTDIDGDGHADVVTGSLVDQSGVLSIRLGNGSGSFGPLRSIPFSNLHPGSFLFNVRAFDLDRDGVLDLAVGVYDCSGSRIVFLQGKGGGDFAESNVFPFPLARGVGLADFDGDGDADFAAVSAMGELAVVENRGNILRDPALVKTSYLDLRRLSLFPVGLAVSQVDGDSDPDLIIPTSSGILTYLGGDGLQFSPQAGFPSGGSAGAFYSAYDAVVADFNRDGKDDLAVACQQGSCVTLYLGAADGKPLDGRSSRSFRVPSSEVLASGDIDGDGATDLAGSGEFLWTALSSRKPRPGKPPVRDRGRQSIQGVVINEILAIDNDFGSPLPEDAGKSPDWVEIYNGSPLSSLLGRWQLILRVPGVEAREFLFPDAAVLQPGEHRLVVFSAERRTPYHTGFKLPGDGATLELLDGSSRVIDIVKYPRQFEDVSYGRFEDGLPAFAFHVQPSPGRANVYAGSVPPQVELAGVDPASPSAPEAITFLARGMDDTGFASVSVHYRVRGVGGVQGEARRAELEDVTSHEEETSGVRTFKGQILEGLTPGILEFYLEAADQSGQAVTAPESASFHDGQPGDGDEAPALFRMPVGASEGDPPRLRLSEVVARNETGLKDESGAHPDWVEIQNCSGFAVNLSRFSLARDLATSEGAYSFPSIQLEPGAFFIVYCDGDAEDGVQHAPFSLDGEGDRLFLIHRGVPGAGAPLDQAPLLIDAVAFGPQEPDVAWARAECGSGWSSRLPTPSAHNAPALVARGDVNVDERLDLADPVSLLGHLFRGVPAACPAAGEVNGDGKIDLTDAVVLLIGLFQGGPAPAGGAVPSARCGSP